MKDKLIELASQRAGIAPEQAEKAVDAVLDYLKNNPDKIKGLLGTNGMGGIGAKLTGMFKR